MYIHVVLLTCDLSLQYPCLCCPCVLPVTYKKMYYDLRLRVRSPFQLIPEFYQPPGDFLLNLQVHEHIVHYIKRKKEGKERKNRQFTRASKALTYMYTQPQHLRKYIHAHSHKRYYMCMNDVICSVLLTGLGSGGED